MAKPRPPKIEPEDIPVQPQDELERFLCKLYFRLRNGARAIEKGDLNESWVALEALGAIFPVLAEGLTHEQVKGAYPFEHWRDNTVELPVGLLRVVVESWLEYHGSESLSLGQAFGFEPLNRQGQRSMKRRAAKLDELHKLAAQVDIRYRAIGDEEPRSLDSVVAEVAEIFNVSERTVERAYAEFRVGIQENLGLFPFQQGINAKTS